MERRERWRETVREWARGGETGPPRHEFYQENPFDVSDADWGFHYPADLLKVAYIMWEASGFSRIPDIREVAALDPDYLTDLNRLHRIRRFYSEDDPILGFAEGATPWAKT
jgi:hypothetical protein